MEATLDVEWAHAIAPDAKILLVEARSPSRTDLMAAVDYARSLPDVVAISMSWGDDEFKSETNYNFHFTSNYNAVFFAASGDNGSGTMWPACSANVVGVGGTTLTLNSDGSVASETAWSGSGGGISTYEAIPSFQSDYGLTGTRRAVPDVSYNGNPSTGFAVYFNSNWIRVGGTSAGAPQWAAIYALDLSANNQNFYARAKSAAATYFRDITLGSNGYSATVGYDYVTGLGSPLTINFETPTPQTVANYLTLQPASGSTNLNTTNQFTVTYTLNNTPQVTYVQDGTITFTTDLGTSLVVSGASTGSTAQEQWVLNANGASVAGSNLTLVYYDLLAQSTSYAVVSGGSSAVPMLTYLTAPSSAGAQSALQSATLQLAQTPQTVWVQKATVLSITNPLTATATEQWLTQTTTWTAQTPNQLPQQILYSHQYLLTIIGAQTSTQWVNSGETAQVTLQGVTDRSNGTGQRLSSYTIDSGSTVQINPTTAVTTVSVLMDAAHQILLTTVQQYQINLDASATAQIASITAPTITGDSYWYDAGTSVQVTLNGLGTRSGGVGERVSAYIINTIPTSVATTGIIAVFNAPVFSAQTISATLTTQYQFSSPSGLTVAVTESTLPQDNGWYDTGTIVTATYNYTWGTTATTRQNAFSYTLNQNVPTALNRQATGTFAVQIAMTQPQTVAVSSITQYLFTVTGGYNVVVAPSSPTSDGFFDLGAVISVSSAGTWADTGNSKQVLTAYNLDGALTEFADVESETVSVPTIVIDAPHELTFNSAIQYLVMFAFNDSTGTQTLTPTVLQLEVNSTNVIVPQYSIWLTQETPFQIGSVVWQDAEVAPTPPITYTVNEPLNLTVLCRVFNATLQVTDTSGKPLTGAQVNVTLANQTTVEAITGADGLVALQLIPQGPFNATVVYQSSTTTIAGDASIQAVTAGIIPVPTNLPMQILQFSIGALAVAAVVALLVEEKRKLKAALKHTSE
jgi:hypothetical protein